MKGKILTWDEFREVCRKDALDWHYSGWKSFELTYEDIINDYSDDYFCDDTDDYYDELSSCFTPEEFVTKTIEYMEAYEMS